MARIWPVDGGSRQVLSVAGGAVARDDGQRLDAAALGIFTRFDDGHGRPFAEHQSVPLPIEGSRGPRRIFVLGQDPRASSSRKTGES